MSAKKSSPKKNAKAAKPTKPKPAVAKRKIKVVEETTEGVVEVQTPAAETTDKPGKGEKGKKLPSPVAAAEAALAGHIIDGIKTDDAPAEDATPATKPNKAKAKKSDAGSKKLSAIDAAAKVLAESKEPLNAKQMINEMAAKGYWTSPGGKTPHATLYSAILREVNAKGKDARFTKTERGKFTANA